MGESAANCDHSATPRFHSSLRLIECIGHIDRCVKVRVGVASFLEQGPGKATFSLEEVERAGMISAAVMDFIASSGGGEANSTDAASTVQGSSRRSNFIR